MTHLERFIENEKFILSLRLEEVSDDDLEVYLDERHDLWNNLTPEEKHNYHRSKL